jgi:hypothetical protein
MQHFQIYALKQLTDDALGVVHFQFGKRLFYRFPPDVTNTLREVDRKSGHPLRVDFFDDSDVGLRLFLTRYLTLSVPNEQRRALGKEEICDVPSHLFECRPLGGSLARHVHYRCRLGSGNRVMRGCENR